AEVDKARQIHKNHREKKYETPSHHQKPIHSMAITLHDIRPTYDNFLTSITNLDGDVAPATSLLKDRLPVKPKEGLHVYNDAYFLRLESVLKDVFPTLAWIT